MQTEKQKMLAGELYNAADAQLQADQAAAAEWMARYNATCAQPSAQR
ncbi:maltose acetyltransferase, partial [Xanthomonas vasicola pv. musacearum NCPPB 4384]